jgi:D-amino-acid dehydrogenase
MRVAIIGAGVLGASTAFHLALVGAEVVVADAAHAGCATAAGAGIVSPWSSGRVDPDWLRIADAGARYYPSLIQRLAEQGEAETGYRRVGLASQKWRAVMDQAACLSYVAGLTKSSDECLRTGL